MSKDYALFVQSRDSDSAAHEFSERTTRYRHSSRMQGGYWMASWHFSPDDNDIEYMERWFRNRLGHLMTERAGGTRTWHGVIWSMDLAINGWKERRSLETLWNAIKTIYTDTDGNEQETSWYTNATSIARYGRREYIITMDEVTAAQAEAEAQSMLVETADPWPRLLAVGRNIEDGLTVEAVGEVFTANNKYVTAGDDTDDNVSTYIQEIISTDCEFLTVGNIATNTTQVRKSFPTPIRVWDALLQLTMTGNGSTPYTIQVDIDGLMHYQPADSTPVYHWNGANKGLTTVLGNHQPWHVRPGVVRNMTRHKTTTIPGSFLTDGRDSWVAEVSMSDGQEQPQLKPFEFDEEEIERAIEQALRWMEEDDDD